MGDWQREAVRMGIIVAAAGMVLPAPYTPHRLTRKDVVREKKQAQRRRKQKLQKIARRKTRTTP